MTKEIRYTGERIAVLIAIIPLILAAQWATDVIGPWWTLLLAITGPFLLVGPVILFGVAFGGGYMLIGWLRHRPKP
jgi:hypothetical protein